MKVLLTTLNAKYIHTNLAIRILYARNAAYPGLSWREFTIKENQDEVAGICANYEVLAFSCYIWNIEQTLSVARKIKLRNPAAYILLGGPEVSYDWEPVIALPEVDGIITGEGEIPFELFLNHFPDFSCIDGLIWKDSSGGIRKQPDPSRFDISLMSGIMPYAWDPKESLASKVLYLETSRGCPYKCSFCLASLDNRVRYLPDDSIQQTLLYLMEHGKVIKFLDRTFNVKRDFTLAMFEFILQHHRPGNVFQFEITADIVHPDIVDFIIRRVPKGLFRFEIGIQTTNREANLEVSRKQNFEKTRAVILQLRDVVDMHLDLIVGLPLDYWKDIQQSVDDVFALDPPELQLGFLKFLKGTPVRDAMQHHGYVFDTNPPYTIISSNYLSAPELARIQVIEQALEIYWNKKRAVNTLRYLGSRHSFFLLLDELGQLFKDRLNFHRHTLQDIYQLLFQWVEQKHSEHTIASQMAAIDYYCYPKIRPAIRPGTDIPTAQKRVIESFAALDVHRFRYAFVPITFNWDTWIKKRTLQNDQQVVIIEYSGISKPFIRAVRHAFNPDDSPGFHDSVVLSPHP